MSLSMTLMSLIPSILFRLILEDTLVLFKLTSARVKDWCSNQVKVYLSKDFCPLVPKFGGTRKFNSSQSPSVLGDLGGNSLTGSRI
jgi:hypothetical protein